MPTCGSRYLFCDPRGYPHCVSKIKVGGICRGFEGLDACYMGQCIFGRCMPGPTPPVSTRGIFAITAALFSLSVRPLLHLLHKSSLLLLHLHRRHAVPLLRLRLSTASTGIHAARHGQRRGSAPQMLRTCDSTAKLPVSCALPRTIWPMVSGHSRYGCFLVNHGVNCTFLECPARHVSCQQWAAQGQCRGNSQMFMQENCRETCGLCSARKSSTCARPTSALVSSLTVK